MKEVISMNKIKILLIIVLFSCVFTATYCAFSVTLEKSGTIQTTELSAKFLDDNDFLTKIQELDSTITTIDKENDLTRSNTITNEYLTEDNIFSTSDSNVPIYLWIDNGVIYYYTVAIIVDFNTNNT